MDTIETWADFVRGERVVGPRTRRIACTVCDSRDCDARHDGFSGEVADDGRTSPTYWCRQCFDEHVGEGDR